MEVMHILENKVMQLIERAQALQTKNSELVRLNMQLQEKIELLETSLLARDDQNSREVADARALVDAMIQTIDQLVEHDSDVHTSSHV